MADKEPACPICRRDSEVSSDARVAFNHVDVTCTECGHFIVSEELSTGLFTNWPQSSRDRAAKISEAAHTAGRIAVFARPSDLKQLEFPDNEVFSYHQVDEGGIHGGTGDTDNS